jgi:predicted KAP-like P-loop ATPase
MIRAITVILKVRRTVAKVRQKLSWTDKIILIVGPIDRLSILFLASFQTIVKSKYLIITLIVSSS